MCVRDNSRVLSHPRLPECEWAAGSCGADPVALEVDLVDHAPLSTAQVECHELRDREPCLRRHPATPIGNTVEIRIIECSLL